MKSKTALFLVLIFIPFISAQYPADNSGTISKRIILIGDAGDPSSNGEEPVLLALNRIAGEVRDSTAVIFLGDNIYPTGLPDSTDPKRKFYEEQAVRQIRAVTESGAIGFFIPGNHDWNRGGEDGPDYIRRQSEFINRFRNEKISFRPGNACPGPEYFDFGNNLRIIFLDSQWWMQDQEFRGNNGSGCDQESESEIIEALTELAEDEEKLIIIAAHHPLVSYGKHGGRFSLMFHLFPLRELNKNFYLPLPGLGSLLPMVRNLGVSRQDISNPVYGRFIRRIESVIRTRTGIIYASGHDHVLQALRGINNNLYIVSGAGIYDQTDDFVDSGERTLYAEAEPGFFTVDFLKDGTIRLTAHVVTDRTGSTEVRFSTSTRR